MHCNLEEQACVKGGTPYRRSGEKGEQFCREVFDLSPGGILCMAKVMRECVEEILQMLLSITF